MNKNDSSPWWVILLKVIIYALGLILSAYATVEAANFIIH